MVRKLARGGISITVRFADPDDGVSALRFNVGENVTLVNALSGDDASTR